MFLLYINPLNKNYKGEFIYEFIFGESVDIECGEDWMITPASSGKQTPPPMNYISQVELLQNENVELELALNSDNFSMIDAVENIIALGWEMESPDVEKRLVFHYGEEIKSVVDKLYSRDLVFQNKGE